MIINFLVLTILVPLIGFFFILFINDIKKIKIYTILTTCITFLISVFLVLSFNKFTARFQFFTTIFWLSNYNINFSIGIDGISLFFILLTTLLFPICLIVSDDIIKKNIKEYYLIFLLLEFLLLVVFSVLDLLFFYIFFESILIPMYLIIGIWGPRERKIKASYLFFIYTLIGSLLMLLAILDIYIKKGTTDYQVLLYKSFSLFEQKFYWIAFFTSFAVKVPMFPFHIWLPEAHVEAPTSGSVILAGILLKLGSYGFLRFSFPLFPNATIFFTPLIYTLCVIGIIFTSLTALRQTDMKRIIAYASVSHMNLILLGMFSLNFQGIEGSILQMLSHGLVSSGLFLMIGVLYDRYHTRLISYYSGLVHVMPFFACIFLLYIISNIALPGTSSFVGELLILIGISQDSITIAFLGATGMFLGGAYSLWLYNRICFGNIQNYSLKIFYDMTFREILINTPIIILIFVMGIFPNLFLEYMHFSVQALIAHIFYSL